MCNIESISLSLELISVLLMVFVGLTLFSLANDKEKIMMLCFFMVICIAVAIVTSDIL